MEHTPDLNIAVSPDVSNWLTDSNEIRNSGTKNASMSTPLSLTVPYLFAYTVLLSPSLINIFVSVSEAFRKSLILLL